MPAGRPSKYSEAYCAEVIAHMAEGASLTSFAAEIGVDRSTIAEWTRAHPEFSLAVTRAKAKCLAWWEKQARKLASTGTGNATMCVFGLKNMGGEDWRDKTEVEHSGGVKVSRVELVGGDGTSPTSA